MGMRLLFSLLLLLLPLFALAEGRLAVYPHDFDPPLLGQVQGALKAREKLGFGKVLLLPTLQPKGGRGSLAERLELLRAAVGNDERFLVPTLQEMEALGSGGSEEKIWQALVEKHQPEDGKSTVLLADPQSPEPVKGRPHSLFPGKKGLAYLKPNEEKPPPAFAKASKIPVPAGQFDAAGFRANPMERSILLSASVAAKLPPSYGDITGGFHSLPEAVTKQLQFEQLLNDRIENTEIFESIHESDLPRHYQPENRPVFRLFTN